MAFYDCPTTYVESATELKDRITKIDNLIVALEDAALKVAAGEDVKEYSLDDGQTKVRAVVGSSKEIAESIEAYERIKQRYVNRLDGTGIMRAVDGPSHYFR